MKSYRLITFVAAVLITGFAAWFLSDAKISVPASQADVIEVQAP
jgi:archaellum component FlaG (FlaF/FlaG flagellin family)